MNQLDGLIEQATALLRKANYVVALTGAGISTPSGIPDFRSPSSGLWERHDPMEVASLTGFKRDPQQFYDWIRPLAHTLLAAQPNPAHLALAELEAAGKLKAVITQNIDMLHTRAGSTAVHEVHGHLREVTCLRCYEIFNAANFWDEVVQNGGVPHCPNCGGVLKPNVILFGELLPVSVLNQARREARACDLMLVAGSSLTVAPAGDLPYLAKPTGAGLIIVNFEETHLDYLADVVIHGDVADVLPKLAAGVRVN
ncbi:MAG: NAD-dependent deacetylase [Anaerolineae bacterium]